MLNQAVMLCATLWPGESEALLLAHAVAAVHGTRLCLLVGVVVGFGQGLHHVLCRGVLQGM